MAKPSSNKKAPVNVFQLVSCELELITFSLILALHDQLRAFSKDSKEALQFVRRFIVEDEEGKKALAHYFPELEAFLKEKPEHTMSLYRTLENAFKSGQIKAAPIDFQVSIEQTRRGAGTSKQFTDYMVLNNMALYNTVNQWLENAQKPRAFGGQKKKVLPLTAAFKADLTSFDHISAEALKDQKQRSEAMKAKLAGKKKASEDEDEDEVVKPTSKAKAAPVQSSKPSTKAKAAPVIEPDEDEDEDEEVIIKPTSKSSKAAPVQAPKASSKAKAAPVQAEADEDEDEDEDDFNF